MDSVAAMSERIHWRLAATTGLPATQARSLGRPLLWCGIAGPPLFVLVFLVDGFVHPRYNAVSDLVSELSRGELGWLQIANFLVLAVAMLAFAAGIRWGVERGAGSGTGSLLFAVMGAGLIVAGVFVGDAHGSGAVHTQSGSIHNWASLPVFGSLALACFVFAGRFRGWMQNYSVASGVLFLVLVVAMVVGENLFDLGGLLQRVALVVGFAWITVLALMLRAEVAIPEERRQVSRATNQDRGKHAWIVFAILNPICVFFGSTYFTSPSTSVRAQYATAGFLSDPGQVLGAYVIVSALALFIVGVTAFRQGRRWAWYAACYQVVLFAVVQIVGGGGVIAVAFGIIAIAALAWSYRRFFPADGALKASMPVA